MASALAAGVDLGSSGIRLVLIDPQGQLLDERATAYPSSFEDPLGWRQGLAGLLQQLPASLRKRLGAISLDGTSGTLLACRSDGAPWALPWPTAMPVPSRQRRWQSWCLPAAPPPV